MKPNFETMSIRELKNYVLLNRHDDEAFYQLADRLESSDNDADLYPIPDTPENIALMETAMRSQIEKLEQNKSS
jgi:hypothetical protein